jgi:hypothetical protein
MINLENLAELFASAADRHGDNADAVLYRKLAQELLLRSATKPTVGY